MEIGKLGCKPPRLDARTLKFSRYLEVGTLPVAPPKIRYGDKVKPPWQMFLNDRLGCCTIATTAHKLQTWTANVGQQVNITDQDVLQAYMAVSGFDPNTGANDNGAVVLDVLNYWRRVGVGGHKIAAYAAVDCAPFNVREAQEAIHLFGSLYLGIALPKAINDLGDTWTYPKGPTARLPKWRPGGLGGHAVNIVNYYTDPKSKLRMFDIVTWGGIVHVSEGFLLNCCTEAYAILTEDWFNGSKQAPNGYALAELQKDLQIIAA